MTGVAPVSVVSSQKQKRVIAREGMGKSKNSLGPEVPGSPGSELRSWCEQVGPPLMGSAGHRTREMHPNTRQFARDEWSAR